MEYSSAPLLSSKDEEEETISLCCGFIHQKRRKPQETVSSVLERLAELDRAQTMKINSLWSHMCEKREEAVRANKQGDVEGAKSHVRIFIQMKEKRAKMFAKHENLLSVSNTIKVAYENAILANTIKESNATLESLAAATPDIHDLMDRLHDNLYIAEETNEILAEPVFTKEDVEDELKIMIDRRDSVEATLLNLPDVPSKEKKKNQNKQMVALYSEEEM
jgi:hypothetical protein